MELKLFVTRRYYLMPELWYKTSRPALLFVRLGEGRHEWHFDRVTRLFPGFWRNMGEFWFSYHLLFRRLGE